nr:hypothetical protein [uncultured Gellertiella sp.]
MTNKILSAIVIAGALFGASSAFADAGGACNSNPASAGSVISSELSSISKLSGDAKRSALTSFINGLGSASYSSKAGGACAAAAIQQAASLYDDPADQQLAQNIASNIGQPTTQTAALNDNAGANQNGGKSGSGN